MALRSQKPTSQSRRALLLRAAFVLFVASLSCRLFNAVAIVPPTAAKNPFDVLGVDFNVDSDAVRKAFRKLAKTYHPDMVDTGCTEQFKKLQWAANELASEAGRAMWQARAAPSGASFGMVSEPFDLYEHVLASHPNFPWSAYRIDVYDAIFNVREACVSRSRQKRQRKHKKESFQKSGKDWDEKRKRASGRIATPAAGPWDKCKEAMLHQKRLDKQRQRSRKLERQNKLRRNGLDM